MKLNVREWGESDAEVAVVCVHGVGQHGGIFGELAAKLVALGARVVALDLRGHGKSTREPPWDVDTHVADVIETVGSLRIERAIWIGHSFGGRVVATLAATTRDLVDSLVLLEPGLEVHPTYALEKAEIERLDWSFATVDGAVAALLGSGVPAGTEALVRCYVEEDLVKGPDHRLRLNFSPAAVVVAWSEMCRPHPDLPETDVLVVVGGGDSKVPTIAVDRFRQILGDDVSVATVPHGHNVLWEAPEETIRAVTEFIVGRSSLQGLGSATS